MTSFFGRCCRPPKAVAACSILFNIACVFYQSIVSPKLLVCLFSFPFCKACLACKTQNDSLILHKGFLLIDLVFLAELFMPHKSSDFFMQAIANGLQEALDLHMLPDVPELCRLQPNMMTAKRLLTYSHRLSYTSFAAQSSIGQQLFRPPAPQEWDFRASVLHRLSGKAFQLSKLPKGKNTWIYMAFKLSIFLAQRLSYTDTVCLQFQKEESSSMQKSPTNISLGSSPFPKFQSFLTLTTYLGQSSNVIICRPIV